MTGAASLTRDESTKVARIHLMNAREHLFRLHCEQPRHHHRTGGVQAEVVKQFTQP
jgi:hypothetical protein